MNKLLTWKIHLRHDAPQLPEAILTPADSLPKLGLPHELAVLLPARHPDNNWIAGACENVDNPAHLALGVFLGSPLLRRQDLFAELQMAARPWLINLPSSAQHDPEFVGHLDEVSLGPSVEYSVLKFYADLGLRVIATVGNAQEAGIALDLGLKTLLVMPKASAYVGGFPSELARRNTVAEVVKAAKARDVTLLGYVRASEASVSSVWPPEAAGVVEQPQLSK